MHSMFKYKIKLSRIFVTGIFKLIFSKFQKRIQLKCYISGMELSQDPAKQ